MFSGWTQVAFVSEVTDPVVAVDVADLALAAVRREGGPARVYDARCPHRGAHLGHGGLLDGDGLVCPFHGYRIRLDAADGPPAAGGPFRVRGYPCLQAAAGVFALFDEHLDTGLARELVELDRTHHVIPGFTVDLDVPAEVVVENVVDVDHFRAVHGVAERPQMEVGDGPDGTLEVRGEFDVRRANRWQVGAADGLVRTRFAARVYSPTLVLTELGPEGGAYVVITAATPLPAARRPRCRVRVTAAVPRRGERPATVREVASILSGSRTAFQQDAAVWEHLDLTARPCWTVGDEPVRRFREFVERFRSALPGVPG